MSVNMSTENCSKITLLFNKESNYFSCGKSLWLILHVCRDSLFGALSQCNRPYMCATRECPCILSMTAVPPTSKLWNSVLHPTRQVFWDMARFLVIYQKKPSTAFKHTHQRCTPQSSCLSSTAFHTHAAAIPAPEHHGQQARWDVRVQTSSWRHVMASQCVWRDNHTKDEVGKSKHRIRIVTNHHAAPARLGEIQCARDHRHAHLTANKSDGRGLP